MLTLEEAIAWHEGYAEYDKTIGCPIIAGKNNQYADWLRELQERRKQPELDSEALIRTIEIGITATNSNDIYSLGMRNGMRWCKSLIDHAEPKFEDYVTSDDDWKEWPSAQPEIIRCKDCMHWRQQTNYAGVKLSFGFCESDDMWCSLYGETCEVSHIDTDDDFYCGYAERRAE